MTRSARDVIAGHLETQLEYLRAREADVRRGEPDSVHQMRVTARRISGALATFRPLWEGADTGRLRAELKWLGGALGAARDAEVMRERLGGLVGAHAERDGSAARHQAWSLVESGLRRDERDAVGAVMEALDSKRYQQLLTDLDGLADSGPWSALAKQKARKAQGPLVRGDWRRVRRRARKASREASATCQAALLHEVRKAARRA